MQSPVRSDGFLGHSKRTGNIGEGSHVINSVCHSIASSVCHSYISVGMLHMMKVHHPILFLSAPFLSPCSSLSDHRLRIARSFIQWRLRWPSGASVDAGHFGCFRLGTVCGCMLCVPGKLFAAGLEPAWLVQSDDMHGPTNVETAASGSMVQILGSPGLAS